MRGQEHYELAEALLDSCQVESLSDIDDKGRVVEHYPGLEDGECSIGHPLAAAQIHATLALVAAMSDPTGSVGKP